MPKSFSAELGAWKASVERRLDNLASGNRLDHASLDGTTLYLKGDGELGRIGRQPDGSMGVHVVKVQPPPQLTAPILTVGEQAGTCLVEWDGGTFDGRRMPLIHGHTEVWAELVGGDWSPTVAPGDTAKRVGTIRDRTGGEVVVALPQAGVWAVWLRAMGADRETAGPWSPVSQVEIVPLVDTSEWEEKLEIERDRITEADERLTLGQDALDGKLEFLDTERLPALDSALTDTRLGMENLRDVRLPDLQDTLNDGLADANEWREVGAVSASSVRIGDYENLLPEEFLWEFRDRGTNSPLWHPRSYGANGWRTIITGSRPIELQFQYSAWGGSTTRLALMGTSAMGIPVQPGDEFVISGNSWSSSANPDGAIRLEVRYATETDGVITRNPVTNIGVGDFSAVIVVPNNPDIRRIQLEFSAYSNAGGDANLRDMRFRRRATGDLIVDNAISARQIMAESVAAAVGEFLQITAENVAAEAIKAGALDVEDIFGATAVIEAIWTDIVRAKMIETQGFITEDMIATGAITTPKLTVTEEMVAEVARLLRIEAGSLASNDIEAMRIVSSLIEATVYLIHDANGDVSVRLDGVSNYIAGRLHAGIDPDRGITMDHGEQVLNIGLDDDGEPDQTVTWDAPYMEFQTDMGHERNPTITVDPNNGGLRIAPGALPDTPRFRSRLNISGDVRANRHISGSSRAVSGHYLVEGTDDDDQSNIIGGLYRVGGRTRLVGRTPEFASSTDMIATTNQGPMTFEDGRQSLAGSTTWANPVETGARRPVAQVNSNNAAFTSTRAWSVTTYSTTASGFNWRIWRDSGTSGGNDVWLRTIATWA